MYTHQHTHTHTHTRTHTHTNTHTHTHTHQHTHTHTHTNTHILSLHSVHVLGRLSLSLSLSLYVFARAHTISLPSERAPSSPPLTHTHASMSQIRKYVCIARYVCMYVAHYWTFFTDENVLWLQGVMIIVYTLRYLPILETLPRGRRDLKAGREGPWCFWPGEGGKYDGCEFENSVLCWWVTYS
jgi:hypothetical protein